MFFHSAAGGNSSLYNIKAAHTGYCSLAPSCSWPLVSRAVDPDLRTALKFYNAFSHTLYVYSVRPIAHVVPLFLLGCLLPCLRCADKHRSSSGSGRAQNALTSIGVPAEAERLNTRFPSASVSKGSSPPNLSDPSACRCSEYLKPRKRNRTQLGGDLDFCLKMLEMHTKSK